MIQFDWNFWMGWNYQLVTIIILVGASLKIVIFYWYWVAESIPRCMQLEQIRGLSIASTETFAKFWGELICIDIGVYVLVQGDLITCPLHPVTVF